MRKHFFVNENDGYLTSEQNRQQPIRNPITGSIKNNSFIEISMFSVRLRSNYDDRNVEK